MVTGDINLICGVLDANDFNITTNGFYMGNGLDTYSLMFNSNISTGRGNCILYMGNGTWTLRYNAYAWKICGFNSLESTISLSANKTIVYGENSTLKYSFSSACKLMYLTEYNDACTLYNKIVAVSSTSLSTTLNLDSYMNNVDHHIKQLDISVPNLHVNLPEVLKTSKLIANGDASYYVYLLGKTYGSNSILTLYVKNKGQNYKVDDYIIIVCG